MYKKITGLNCRQCCTEIWGRQSPTTPVILASWYSCLWGVVCIVTRTDDLDNQDYTLEMTCVPSEART